MTPATPQSHDDDYAPAPDEAEILISRIIDDEATDEDRVRFQQLATLEPLAWRRLALRQQDMLRLSADVDAATASMTAIDLPPAATSNTPGRTAPARRAWQLTNTIALAGWAAVLILGATWALSAMFAPMPEADIAVDDGLEGAERSTLSPDDYLGLYLEEGLRRGEVVGEMQPIFMRIEQRDDDSFQLFFLRRLEESITLTQDELDTLINEQGDFTRHPADLRDDGEPVIFDEEPALNSS